MGSRVAGIGDLESGRIPDYIESVIGWRTWSWQRKHGLRSVVKEESWVPGHPNSAECRETFAYLGALLKREVSLRTSFADGHQAPVDWCRCGIYALRTPAGLPTKTGGDFTIVGRVRLWGHVVQGPRGWRAQFAYPDSLFVVTGSRRRRREDLLERALVDLERFSVSVATVRDPRALGAGAVRWRDRLLPRSVR